jgi:hypothetical protein
MTGLGAVNWTGVRTSGQLGAGPQCGLVRLRCSPEVVTVVRPAYCRVT